MTETSQQHHPNAHREAARVRGRIANLYRRTIRPLFSRRLARLSTWLVPYVYLLYMRLVWATSRIEGRDEFTLAEIARQHDGAVGLLWHEEVFTVAYGYARVGIRSHTLASLGESGDLIARMLELCGHVVFRGGSSTKRGRRKLTVLLDMIKHMQSTREVIYGLTVDGSKGPRYRMKLGGVMIARKCGKPIVLVRTWYRRCIRLNTWDRMAVPLPFNVIRYSMRGPYFVPEDAHGDAGLQAFGRILEDELIDLAARSYDDMGQRRPDALIKRPEGEIMTNDDGPAVTGV